MSNDLSTSAELDNVSLDPVSIKNKNSDRSWLRTFMYWGIVNVCLLAFFLYGLLAPASDIKQAFLPGTTTHGHYQIELDCNACHRPVAKGKKHSAKNVMQNACIDCHGDQLKAARDTHPASKFNDPTNADRLKILDARNCLTCHQEHVPDRTLVMGLTVPTDYCWHCHQDVGDSRPSHVGMAFDSCATSGCHNYHDNRAIYEKFLEDHYGEPDHHSMQILPLTSSMVKRLARYQNEEGQETDDGEARKPLSLADADAPQSLLGDEQRLTDWATTAHAQAGVNCSHCHQVGSEGQKAAIWQDAVALETCQQCHQQAANSFLKGKHGMKLASGLPAMTPAQARLPVHQGAAHQQLSCNACHQGHRFDRQYAAVDACLKCHADSHSTAYQDSPHAQLWAAEISGQGQVGSGVSCASCHLPRLADGKEVWVNHDQNSNLRPNESMAREVCLHCHSLEYSLSSLAETDSVPSCFANPPSARVESVQMAHDWFVEKEQQRRRRRKGSQ